MVVRDCLAVLIAMAVWGGCAPAMLTMTMPHPARTSGTVQGTQSYEVPPYGEDHRYEATLARWTPSSVGFRIHLVNADRCGQPSHYSFELVDDRNGRYRLGLTRIVTESTRPGHLGANISDVTMDGEFGASIGADSRYLILQVRPVADRSCKALDFRWDFQG